MKTALLLTLSALSVSLFATGCAVDVGDTEEEGEGSVESEVVVAQANHGYFVVTRRDVRRCAAPACGGFFVKRVNEAQTTCADGTKAAECYVSDITFGGVGLSAREEAGVRAALEGGHAVVKARTYKQTRSGQTIGILKANEAWVGATGSNADANFYRLADNGVRCITTPCPSTTAFSLNSNDRWDIVSYDLANTELPASEADLAAAQSAVGTPNGILVAGGLAMPKCMPGSNCGPFVHASEFFLPVTRREGKACGARTGLGCNADQFCSWTAEGICGWADATGTCSFKPEMCPMVYQPVCGCDGQTYGNACQAGSAGMSVASDGACAE